MTLTLSKYLDSDYDPIPHTKHIWLPKDFNDRKYLTAYVRKSTRKGIRLFRQGTLSLEEIYSGDIKPRNIKKQLDFSDMKGKVKGNFDKFYSTHFYNGLLDKDKKCDYVSNSEAEFNRKAIEGRKTSFKLNHYAWLFQQALVKHEFNGELPSFSPNN